MSNAVEARRLLRAHRYGALSTLSKKLDGYPFGSITPYVVDQDGSLLILISGLAEHSKNIQHDPRVSLITHNQHDPQIQMQGRVTVLGDAHRVVEAQQASKRYLRHFPEAAAYLAMADFSFWRIQPVAIRYIAGVGRIHWLNIDTYAIARAAEFTLHEEAMLERINTQQLTTLRQLMQHRYGIDTPDTQAIGWDCDGLDVRTGKQSYRLDFATDLTPPDPNTPLTALRYHFP